MEGLSPADAFLDLKGSMYSVICEHTTRHMHRFFVRSGNRLSVCVPLGSVPRVRWRGKALHTHRVMPLLVHHQVALRAQVGSTSIRTGCHRGIGKEGRWRCDTATARCAVLSVLL